MSEKQEKLSKAAAVLHGQFGLTGNILPDIQKELEFLYDTIPEGTKKILISRLVTAANQRLLSGLLQSAQIEAIVSIIQKSIEAVVHQNKVVETEAEPPEAVPTAKSLIIEPESEKQTDFTPLNDESLVLPELPQFNVSDVACDSSICSDGEKVKGKSKGRKSQ